MQNVPSDLEGVLFILGGAFCLLLSLRLWRGGDALTWGVAAATAAAMATGFVLSRTVGLPGFHEEEWELSGLVSLLLEAGVVAAAVAALRVPRPVTSV